MMHDADQNQFSRMLLELEHSGFYGSLELKFEAGSVVLLKKTETIKPNDCRDNRGRYDG